MEIICAHCKQTKLKEEMAREKKTKSGYCWCKKCYAEAAAEQRRKYPEKVKKIQRNSQLKTDYGINTIIYEQMLAQQDGRCAICERPQSMLNRRFAVDHDHTTGKIRGLLCVPCNTSLGKLNNNPAILQRAIVYLTKE